MEVRSEPGALGGYRSGDLLERRRREGGGSIRRQKYVQQSGVFVREVKHVLSKASYFFFLFLMVLMSSCCRH